MLLLDCPMEADASGESMGNNLLKVSTEAQTRDDAQKKAITKQVLKISGQVAVLRAVIMRKVITKQVLKITGQVAVLRSMVLQQLPHIQIKIFEALISETLMKLNKVLKNATVIGRTQEFATFVKTQGQFDIGTAQLLHCKLEKAHSKVNTKLELMIILSTAIMAIWQEITGSLLTTQDGRRQHKEPSDLERKLQKWLRKA